jgi:hypothetical protein
MCAPVCTFFGTYTVRRKAARAVPLGCSFLEIPQIKAAD